jgi:phage FluMu protein Com
MTLNRLFCLFGRHDLLPTGKFDDNWIEWRCPHCKKLTQIPRKG